MYQRLSAGRALSRRRCTNCRPSGPPSRITADMLRRGKARSSRRRGSSAGLAPYVIVSSRPTRWRKEPHQRLTRERGSQPVPGARRPTGWHPHHCAEACRSASRPCLTQPRTDSSLKGLSRIRVRRVHSGSTTTSTSTAKQQRGTRSGQPETRQRTVGSRPSRVLHGGSQG